MVRSVSESRIGTIVLCLRIEHNQQRARVKKRAYESIERHVLAPYGATRRPSGEHQLRLAYRTDKDLEKHRKTADDFELAARHARSQCQYGQLLVRSRLDALLEFLVLLNFTRK
jgi:hypothetical protein